MRVTKLCKSILKFHVFARRYLVNFLDRATIVNIGGIPKGLGNTLALITSKLFIFHLKQPSKEILSYLNLNFI